jgi:1-acyl-sn-glycerol-3-phosphate acyltransferase
LNSDASRQYVEKALAEGHRIGVVPGGISEVFTGDYNANSESVIVRKGFLRMAARQGIPVIPVFCFGASQLFRQLPIPGLEYVSNLLRVGICVFYGVFGLPIPYRQRLMYVTGRPIQLPLSSPSVLSKADEEEHVEWMYQQFCDELHRLFTRHKESYGWAHKSLRLIER